MNLTAETITTAKTVAVFHALMTAAEKSRRVMRMAEDADILRGDAADRLNSILSDLNLDLSEAIDPAPPVPESLVADLVEGDPRKTLRDEFAMLVAADVIKNCSGDTRKNGETLEKMFARKTYLIADAMLAAREEGA